MAEVVRAAIAAGATTINIPDTVGYTVPEEYAAILRGLYERVPELEGVVLSVHCHDDLGMAVANSLAGVEAGARQVECTINGIGERAGNASLEEIVMLLRTRRPRFGLDTSIETTEIVRTSRMVSRLTGYVVQPNKAIVGRNAFAHEAGIHQHGVLANRRTYEIMDAESVGLTGSDIVLGKHSGRHALSQAFADLGFHIEGDDLKRAFARFKEIADRKQKITSLDLEAIASDSLREREDSYHLVSLAISTRTGEPARAEITVRNGDGDQTAEAEGDGPVDAVFRAIDAAAGGSGDARRVHDRRRLRRRGRARRGARRRRVGRPQLRQPGRLHRHHRGVRGGLPAGVRARQDRDRTGAGARRSLMRLEPR